MKLGSQVIFHLRLRRVRRNDFQVAAFAEREQGILRPAAGMHASKNGADTRSFGDKINALLEVARTEKNVIEQSRHLVLGEELGGSRDDSCGENHELASRQHAVS